MTRKLSLVAALVIVAGCSATPGPDKSIIGGVLGAAWGAGAGAVIGNQTNSTGPGAAIGAGFGAMAGLLTGIGLDLSEGTELEHQRELDYLKLSIEDTRRSLASMQQALDARTVQRYYAPPSLDIYFDKGRASLHLGSVAQLERFAETVKANPYVSRLVLHGHSDEMGSRAENMKLSEARARTIATFLGTYGVSQDKIQIVPHGATQPLASNSSDAGRQLNRRVEIVLVR